VTAFIFLIGCQQKALIESLEQMDQEYVISHYVKVNPGDPCPNCGVLEED